MEIKITNKDNSKATFEMSCALDLGSSIFLIARLEAYIEDLESTLKEMGVNMSFLRNNVKYTKQKIRENQDGKDLGIYGVKL